MSATKENMSAEQVDMALEKALTHLEKAVKNSRPAVRGEQAVYLEQLEAKSKKLARDNEEMKKHCIALKNGYEALEEKCRRLETVTDSAEKELTATLRDLDQLIAQKSLH